LRRQVAAAGREIIDEDATADLCAEQRLWLPVLTPAREPALDLALVIDGSDSMTLWEALVREFRTLCEQLGVFRDIRTWHIAASDDGHPVPVLRGASPVSGARDPRELLDPSGRRLIMIVTDGVHPWWQPSGLLQPIVSEWAMANSVAIIQPFPQRLWSRSMLRPAVAEFQAKGPGRHTAHIIRSPSGLPASTTADLDSDALAGDPPETVTVPILEPTPMALHRWARLTAGYGQPVTLAAAVLSRNARSSPPDDWLRTPAAAHPPDPARLVRDFRAIVSPSAYRLAGYLSSAAPLTLPVMRLVQQSMMPESGAAELAEVYLSGLLRRLSAGGPGRNGDSATYGFVAGVREILFSTITRTEALDVQDQVGNYLLSGQGTGRPFPAIAETLTDEDMTAAAEWYPSSFGQIRRMLLERIGGPYAEAARQAQDQDHAQAVSRPESDGGPGDRILRFRHYTGEQVECEARIDDMEFPAGEFLMSRLVWLEDGPELRQHRPVGGSQRRDGYERLDSEIFAGRRLYEVADWGNYPPEVARLYGDEATSADPYTLFEPYQGEPLRDVGEYLMDDEFDDFLVSLLTGLCWLAAAGVAHRAINPDTVFWDGQRRRAQITDFSRSAPFGTARTPAGGSWAWVPWESRPDTCYGTVGSADDVWAAARLIYFVRSRGEDLDDLGKLADSGLTQMFNGLLERVFAPPEERPTASDLIQDGLRRPRLIPRLADGGKPLINGRGSFLSARVRKHPDAQVPAEFWDDITWTRSRRATASPADGDS
jgi:hypothetical protein